MKTTLDIPDELLARIEDQASRDGQNLDQVAVGLLAAGLGTVSPTGEGELVTKSLPRIKALPVAAGPTDAPEMRPPRFKTDPVTGLRVIESPPDAPIHRMTAQEVLDLTNAVLQEQDLEWAGVPVRH